jgi:hypothetical protein
MKNIFVVLILMTGCVSNHRFGWRTYDAGPFRIRIPTEMEKTSAQGIDSYVFGFAGPNVVLQCDYGKFSDLPSMKNDSRQSNFRSYRSQINGENVHIISYRQVPRGGLQFDYNILVNFSDRGLTISGNCAMPTDYEIVMRIARTVKFKPHVRVDSN